MINLGIFRLLNLHNAPGLILCFYFLLFRYDLSTPCSFFISFNVSVNIFQPVYAGEIQGPSLGIEIDIYDQQGNSISNNEKGELVVKRPFPSMPIMFWNDSDDSKISSAYFEKYKNIWHHADYIQRTKNNGYIIYGRSDSTLNPGGVRIGTSEIYQQVEDIDFITEGLVAVSYTHLTLPTNLSV